MNNCFSKFTIQIWICRRSVCELGWTSAHYPGSKHKGPEGYTPINKTVGGGGGGVWMDTDQALRGRAVYARMLVRQQLVQFQVDCGASPNILRLKYAEGECDSCLQTLVI